LSSILNALKKLEAEQTQQDRVRSLSRTVRRQKEKTGGTRSFSRIIIASGIVIFSAMLATGGFIGVSRMMKKKEKTFAGDLAQKAGQLQKEAVKGVKAKNAAIKQSPPLPALLIPEKNHGHGALASPDKLPGGLPEGFSVSEKKERKGTAKSQPESSKPLAPVISKSEESGIKIVQDTGLKLMAIAWSAIPADRIAVINGRIVREGETIEGVFISRINENEVILQKGDELVKLIFRVQ
jgi:hypothetical protein